ncbi:CD3337/EF1877 family mobilome membrane protein [Enterocloster bolteae]|uniref:Conjugative transposon membrane protein n=3 Tax=Enterocloster bolteae TaxID=208479 RepID=R0BI60_9FIRM|nr:conjugative transposon membrane protein [Enterocloster bolteae 90B8]RGO85161.1 YtxH domain-containing protein [Enterocloster bolteae]
MVIHRTSNQQQLPVPYHAKKGLSWKMAGKVIGRVLLALLLILLLLAVSGTAAHAAGLVDDTVDAANEYSKYPLDNYQLDFYVDSGWDWLPWNWLDGIGKQVMYGLYAITNFIWTISLYLSNATGYLIQEAYSLDFISSMADSIGKNMQTLAGVTTGGLSSEGFYIGFLLILILVVGIYVAYTGLIKRETTKAIHAVVNFVVVFVLSAAFIAYAPDYIGKINEFSADISNASLTLGTKIVLPNSENQGKDSVDLIRDSLFSIQVKQPWLLLQYGNSDVESIGTDRVESLLSTSPNEINGQDREEIVVEEIEDRENTNLTITKTINRLGTVFFLFMFNIGISVFVFLLTGIMIFSQVLFIIYAMFLPVSFLLSMVPSFEGMSKRAITKLFNTILTRAGITLIITVAFSISTMLYNLSGEYPFFLTAFLQIVTFAGIYFKLGDLMGMFSLQSGDSQSMGSRIMRRPRMLMHAHMHRLQHKLGRSMAALGAGTAAYHAGKTSGTSAPESGSSKRTQADHSRPNGQAATEKESAWKRAGSAVGAVTDTKDKIADTAGQLREQAKDLPVNAKYALYHGKTQVPEGVLDFTSSVTQTRTARAEQRNTQAESRRQTIAERRAELKQARQPQKTASEAPKGAAPVHKRPATAKTKQPASPAIRERGQVSYGGTVAERTSIPVVKATSIHHEQTPPVRTERQIVPPASPAQPDERQKTTPTITPATLHPARPVQKDTAPVIPEVKRAAPVVKEAGFTIRRTTARKEWTKTAKTAVKQKKGEKP